MAGQITKNCFYVDNCMQVNNPLIAVRHRLLPFLLVVVAAALSLACTKKDQPMNTSYTPIDYSAPDPNAKKYLALGDSYTIGTSVAETDRFPVQTADFLQAMGIKTQVSIIATNGWTSTDLLLAIREKPVTTNYDMVSVLIGVNNQYQGKSLDLYKTDFTAIIQRAIQLADGKPNHVVVLSIPDYSVTPFASNSDKQRIATEIDAFNAANKTIASDYKVNYLYITDESRKAAGDRTLVASDGLHFSGKEYAVWAMQLAAVFKAAL